MKKRVWKATINVVYLALVAHRDTREETVLKAEKLIDNLTSMDDWIYEYTI